MAEIKITITGGRMNLGETLTVPIDSPIIVGRSHVAAIRFANDERGVSGKHLEISVEEDHVWVHNLKTSIRIQGAPLETGNRRELHVGDSIELGDRARFRVDAISGVPRALQREDAVSLTGATHATDLTEVTRAVDMTEATRAVDMTEATCAVDILDATQIMTDAPTGDPLSSDAETEALTGDPFSSTGTQTNNGDKTVALNADDTDKIPEWLINKINDEHRKREIQKKKTRQALLSVAVLLFCAVIGVIVYVRWPKGESVLSVPLNAKGEADVDHYIASSRDVSQAFVVDYPRNPGIKKSELSNGRGIEVSTLIGKDRNVPFRLRLDRTAQPEELTRSLTACAQARMRTEEKNGVVFRSPAEWPAGVYFFESAYPKSCHAPRLQRGTPFYRTEYETVRGNMKWLGVLFIFRDGVTVFTFRREMPAGEWERGKLLLRADANLEFYPAFLEQRWESPGMTELVSKHTPEQLKSQISHELNLPSPRMSQWPRLKRELDTLMVLTWDKRPQIDTSRALLAKFRKQQDSAYVQFVLSFDLLKRSDADEERLNSIREDCRRVFGSDPGDRRFLMISDPERWSCQKEEN